MDHLLRFLLRWRVPRLLRAIARFSHDPAGVQSQVLRHLLGRGAGTEWGRRYGFAEILRESNVAAAFRDRVPLHDYDAYREDILRARCGAADLFWPGRINCFATSAGTTAEGKHTPVTEDLIRANLHHAAAALLCYLVETERLACLRGMPVNLTGAVAEDPQQPGVRVGEISGLAAEFWYSRNRLRHFLLGRRNLPREFCRNTDFEEKLDRIADHAMERDVRIVGMVPSWGLQLFDRLIERHNRAHQRQIAAVRQVWPNLQLIITGGVPLRVYRGLLEARIGRPGVDFVETYGASEAPLAFQSSQADPAMLLNLSNGVYFEFVRYEDFGRKDPRRYGVAEVELGASYVPVVTTCAGLWACSIGDVLRFTQVSPPKIIVVGRTAEMLDSYGEFVLGCQARESLAFACQRTGGQAVHFHLAPRPAGEGRPHAHQWLVEFDGPAPRPGDFAQALDCRLRELNAMYNCCRREKGFGSPEVVVLPRGAFHRWLRVTRGQLTAQTKVPIISDNRDLADGLLAETGDVSA